MTRLGRASVFLAVFAGGYAILMLINGQLTDFGVSAGVCAVALLGAALFAWRAGYGRAPAALPAAVVSTLEPHVSEEVLDSGVGDDRDRATGSGPDSDEWMPAETAIATIPVEGRVHDITVRPDGEYFRVAVSDSVVVINGRHHIVVLLARLQPSVISITLLSTALTSTARMVVTALVGLSILTVHQESPNIGVLMPESKTFRA